MSASSISSTIAVIGGTGKEGKGLAYRWAKAGYPVIVGSRSAEKAAQTAAELLSMLGAGASILGLPNQDAAARAEVVVLTVPYSAHAETLESVKNLMPGKILIDVAVPLMPPQRYKVQMPPAGSAAQEARQILGETVQVAAAFHTIPYDALLRDAPVDCEVLVTGTGKETRVRALELVAAAGLVGWDAGPIENSVVVEGLTSVLININRLYGSTHAGIRVTGVNKG